MCQAFSNLRMKSCYQHGGGGGGRGIGFGQLPNGIYFCYSVTFYAEFLPKKARGVCIIILEVNSLSYSREILTTSLVTQQSYSVLLSMSLIS